MAVLSRLTLTPNDPDRDSLLVWDRHGLPPGEALIGTRPAGRFFAARYAWPGDDSYVSEITLKAGTPAGVHPLTLGGTHVADVTVTGNRPRTPVYQVSPSVGGDDTSVLEYALSRTYPAVRLTPGEYRTTRPLRIPDNKTLSGVGATLTGPDRMLAPGTNVTGTHPGPRRGGVS
jgi:hypothetical protein